MADSWYSPGRAADQAFTSGIKVATVLALAAVGVFYWFGVLSPVSTAVVLLLFPVYLVLVAVALSKWLGFDKDITDLRPVTRPDDRRDYWER